MPPAAGEAGTARAGRDPADRPDGKQRAVRAWPLVQYADHVQDEHREPGGVHGADDADGEGEVPDIRMAS